MASSFLASFRKLKETPGAKNLANWYRNQMGYRQMGLRYDDLIPEESDVVQEALRRLPPKEFHQRLFRFKRAFALSGTQNMLSPSEWTKPEEDIPYLRPLMEQLENEMASKQAFDQMIYIPEALKKRNRSS
ncbi:hypothetical protein SeMB42_g04432 [Synchytrium endobioticum]|uniref:Complex III subunit 7 n=1 Tax=Synchytrium endobioticum TaxID=286115 RepID=A0A507CY95_9FUNG|nr:hypothetical protein SeLEV6574_g04881 [Synchytrium endobioticum]TPX44105.1 hypothetical protein SeMB42_g04432 [Synchytrium endobioticum]